MARVDRSPARSQQGAWRNAGQFMGAVVVGPERVTIKTGGATLDAAVIVARVQGGLPPGLIIGHGTFDRKQPLIEVGNDEEERAGRLRGGHR